jgi:hypothetical protein
VTVPKGAVVKVMNGRLDGTRLVDVEWNGEAVMIFTVDLRKRGTLIAQHQESSVCAEQPCSRVCSNSARLAASNSSLASSTTAQRRSYPCFDILPSVIARSWTAAEWAFTLAL